MIREDSASLKVFDGKINKWDIPGLPLTRRLRLPRNPPLDRFYFPWVIVTDSWDPSMSTQIGNNAAVSVSSLDISGACIVLFKFKKCPVDEHSLRDNISNVDIGDTLSAAFPCCYSVLRTSAGARWQQVLEICSTETRVLRQRARAWHLGFVNFDIE